MKKKTRKKTPQETVAGDLQTIEINLLWYTHEFSTNSSNVDLTVNFFYFQTTSVCGPQFIMRLYDIWHGLNKDSS